MKKRVKTRLGMIIAIIVIYMVIEVAGVTSMHFYHVGIDSESRVAVNSISKIRSQVNEIDKNIYKMVGNIALDKTNLNEEIQKEFKELDSSMSEYSELSKSSDEIEEFGILQDTYKKYVTEANKIVNLVIDSANIKKAQLLYDEDFNTYRTELVASADNLYALADEHHENNLRGAAFRRDITTNITLILSIIFLVILIRMDRKRMRTERELIETEDRVVKQKAKISTAVLKDVLTETENRMSFINRFSGEKSKINNGYAYYFIMFNIDDFSSVNSTYGVKSGDLILNSSARKIMNVFEGSAVYRTGSDEFVVALSTTSDTEGYNRVTGLIEKARESLSTANQIKTGSLVVSYSVSVVKKTGPCTVDSTVLGTLTETMKQGRVSQPGAVMFTELN